MWLVAFLQMAMLRVFISNVVMKDHEVSYQEAPARCYHGDQVLGLVTSRLGE